MTSCPIPHHPHDVGVDETCPDLAQIEGAHLLANAARAFLTGCGFDDDQIEEWAKSYIAEYGSGDIQTFVGWIHSYGTVPPPHSQSRNEQDRTRQTSAPA